MLSKLLKRGDEGIKSLAQKILDNAVAFSKQKLNDSKGISTHELKESRSAGATNVRVPPAVAGVKRPRESVVLSAQPVKKTALTTKASVLPSATSLKATISSSKRPEAAKSEEKATTVSTGAITAAPKVKVNHVTAKPSTFFSSLQSASKKPGTSIAAQKTALQNDGKTSISENKASGSSLASIAVSKPSFSFAETMANLTKPKEVAPTSKVEENRPPETAEEKIKRLRKEERRKLRVSFKPEDSLVEIRLFVHDPEEEIGHDESMVRDVDDVGGEGRMLKMHIGVDDDEDGTDDLAPWTSPSCQ